MPDNFKERIHFVPFDRDLVSNFHDYRQKFCAEHPSFLQSSVSHLHDFHSSSCAKREDYPLMHPKPFVRFGLLVDCWIVQLKCAELAIGVLQ